MLLTPQEIGLPEKFARWRKEQSQGIARAIDSRRRFVLQNAPTGSGKSAMGVAQALLTGKRTLYTTATRGLQTQAMKDFSSIGMTDIRGMSSYPCILSDPVVQHKEVSCADGACRSGYRCQHRDDGCSYYDAWRKACEKDLDITNYQYWMTVNAYGEGLGKFDLMICDEAHNIINELSLFLQFQFEAHEIEGVIGSRWPEGDEIETWVEWARYWCPQVSARITVMMEEAKQHYRDSHLPYRHHREIRVLKDIHRRLDSLSNLQGEWVAEKIGKRIMFDPVWPSEQAEATLFRGIGSVVLYSATICEKTADLLGIPPDSRDYYEYPSTFPTHRRPIIHVPTVKVGMNMSEQDKRFWAAKCDQLIGKRLQRKGIIHTRSYRYRDYLLSRSNYAKYMLTHDAGSAWDTEKKVEQFKESKPPCILVSPALGTGWDFPDDEARWQIIAKLPFPDKSSKVLQARMARDKDYYGYLTAQDLQQMCGRIVRSKEDWGETLIIDDHIKWFVHASRPYLADWWRQAYKSAPSNPKPLDLS